MGPRRETAVFETFLSHRGGESIDHPVAARRVSRSACETAIIGRGLSSSGTAIIPPAQSGPGSDRLRRDRILYLASWQPAPLRAPISLARLSVPLRARRVPRLRGTCHRFRPPPTSFHPPLSLLPFLYNFELHTKHLSIVVVDCSRFVKRDISVLSNYPSINITRRYVFVTFILV